MHRSWGKGLFAALLSLAAACDGLSDVTEGTVATSMRAATPASFEASVGGQVPQWMAVQVLDQFTRPMEGVDVAWTVTAGDGSVSVVNAETDAEGVSRAYWTIGLRLDLTHQLRASVDGLAPVEFTAQPRHPDPTGINQYVTKAGDGQTGTVGQPLGEPLRVRLVTPDGRGVVGAPVQLTVTAGNGTVTPLAAGTDAQGYATFSWTLGTTAGPQQVSYQVLNATGTFTATARAAAPSSIQIVRLANEWVNPGHQQQVGLQVRDALGNPVAGVDVTWTVLTGGGAVDSVVTHTDADGTAYGLWTAGSAVDVFNRLQAQVADLGSVEFHTTTKAFFFGIISPPSPGPGAIVMGSTLRVEARTFPYHPVTEGHRVTSFTLEVAGRTSPFHVVLGPSRWLADVSLAGLEPGEYVYTVTAQDDLGNTHAESVTFYYSPSP